VTISVAKKKIKIFRVVLLSPASFQATLFFKGKVDILLRAYIMIREGSHEDFFIGKAVVKEGRE